MIGKEQKRHLSILCLGGCLFPAGSEHLTTKFKVCFNLTYFVFLIFLTFYPLALYRKPHILILRYFLKVSEPERRKICRITAGAYSVKHTHFHTPTVSVSVICSARLSPPAANVLAARPGLEDGSRKSLFSSFMTH